MRASSVMVAVVLALGGCAATDQNTGNGDGPDGAGSAPAAQPGLSQVRVFADEQLREAFDQVETQFEMQHPNVEPVLSYGEGIDLARRIAGGEPVEVFVTEDPSAMATVTAFDKSEAETFAGGQLQILTVGNAGAPFVDFVRQGAGSRVLIDAGVLRP